MLLKVKILQGGELSLQVSQAQTIAAVKRQIEGEHGIAVEQQRLMLNGRPLADGMCLCDYQIIDGGKVHLAIKSAKPKTPAAPSIKSPNERKEHFWATLKSVLKRHFTEQDCAKLIAQFDEDYNGYIDNLSLDDIEVLAGIMQEAKPTEAPG